MKRVNIIKNKAYRIESFVDLETKDCKIIFKVRDVEKNVLKYNFEKSSYTEIAKKIWEKDSVKIYKSIETKFNVREDLMKAFLETLREFTSNDLDYSEDFKIAMQYDCVNMEYKFPEDAIVVSRISRIGNGEPNDSKLICYYKRDTLKIKCFRVTNKIGTLSVRTPVCPLPCVNIDINKMNVNQAVKLIFEDFADDVVELAKVNDSILVLADALKFLLEELSGYHLGYTQEFLKFLNSSDNEKTLPEVCVEVTGIFRR